MEQRPILRMPGHASPPTTITIGAPLEAAREQQREPPDLLDDGKIQIGDHDIGNSKGERVGVYYDVDKARADAMHAKLNSHYFSISAYAIATIAFVLRLFAFFAAVFVGGILLAEIMIVFVWVEPLVVFFDWTRHLSLLFGAFWIVVMSFLAKGLYLFLWTFNYWGFVDQTWWWIEVGVVGGYAIVAFALLYSVANVLKAKIAFCGLINDLDRIEQRKT